MLIYPSTWLTHHCYVAVNLELASCPGFEVSPVMLCRGVVQIVLASRELPPGLPLHQTLRDTGKPRGGVSLEQSWELLVAWRTRARRVQKLLNKLHTEVPKAFKHGKSLLQFVKITGCGFYAGSNFCFQRSEPHK